MIWGSHDLRPRARRFDWSLLVLALALATGCGGGCGGCSALEPIPGGFPLAKRTPNAVQVRVTSTGLAAISADPAALLGSVAGGMNGVLSFSAPAQCGGSTPLCCPNGQPLQPCGPINIDLNEQTGDTPRLELRPSQGNNRLDVTLRARVRTAMDLPIRLPIIGNCGVRIDTTRSGAPDMNVDVGVSFDIASGTTRVEVGDVELSSFGTADVSLIGGFGCDVGDAILGLFLGLLTDQITGAIEAAVADQVCKACPGGTVAECGPTATACTANVCQGPDGCVQELGLSGRLRGTALFSGFSPGTTGAIDLYEVAGGYATTNGNGIALGVLGGMLPAGAPRDRCGPSAGPEPARPTIAPSAFFASNTRPDNNEAFGVGIGVHTSQLAQFAWAAYEGGLLCLTPSNNSIDLLSTDTLSLISRSLGKLVLGNAPMAIGLRPQSPPQIGLGRNVFVDDGQGGKTLQEPLLDLRFSGLELDFFVSIDGQYVRAFTVVADVHLPIGLQVTDLGELSPVIGAPADAFTNISVKNSDAVTETPAELSALFPNLLGLVLPQLASGLGTIALPAVGGLSLQIKDVTAVPQAVGGSDLSYLAIYADLATPTPARRVSTTAAIGPVQAAPAAIAADPTRWRTAATPRVTLDLGGDGAAMEWSWRIDGGTWSAWSSHARPSVSSPVFWLPGTHAIEVRAREAGVAGSVDATPVALRVAFDGSLPAARAGATAFHGAPGEAGCSCATGGDPLGGLPLVLAIGGVLLPLRRVRRGVRAVLRGAARGGLRAGVRAAKLGALVWLVAIALLPGCSCGGEHCGDTECLEGEVEHGGLGRWTSVAADGERVLAATYDQGYGDLVVADVTEPGAVALVAVDGVPRDVPATYAAGTYRDGIEESGDDVGAYTSIALAGGRGHVAYQDRDAGALKFARERDRGAWDSHTVDAGDGAAEAGRYASLVFDASGNPAIAYLALGIDDGSGARVSELRVARARRPDPGAGDWAIQAIASAPGICGGLCNAGEACIAGAAGPTCAAVTSDCAAACPTGEACVAGACTAEQAAPTAETIGSGTGLFVSLVALSDGRLAAAYYNAAARSLELAVETAAGSNEFMAVVLDGGVNGDRGMWASAIADASDTIHIAYQDALGDQLMYVSWSGGTATTPEVVDDGQRDGDRPHPVGAAAAIYLVGGTPSIAYQDGATADVHVATRSGGTWTTSPFAAGPAIDGLSIAATTGHRDIAYLAWGRIDPRETVPNSLAIETP